MSAENLVGIELPSPDDVVSSVSFHPSDPNLLISSCWDSVLRLYDLSALNTSDSSTFPSTLKASIGTIGEGPPILDAVFGADGGSGAGKVYTGGLDGRVREIDVSTSFSTLLGERGKGVSSLVWSKEINALLAGSWDHTVTIYDPRTPVATPSPSSTCQSISLHHPGKVFSMDATDSKVVVAMSGRNVWIWDVRMLGDKLKSGGGGEGVEPWQKRESSLKYMTRAVACMPRGEGYVSTSIEGRVSVEFFDADVQSKNYAFKCHRSVIDGTDTVFPVTDVAFHPKYGTFATGGGDSIISIWDPAAKKRVKQFPKYPSPISSLSFNADGSRLAIACHNMVEEGTLKYASEGGARNVIMIKTTGDECKPKAKS